MRYRGRHREVVRHHRLRGVLTVAAVTGSALVAPLATGPAATVHATSPTPVPSFTEYERAS